MEYTLNYYKQNRGSIYTTSDGHKYLVTKRKNTEIYLKCVLFRKGCKSKAKFNQDINKISLSSQHNHGLDDNKDDIYSIKRACKVAAKSSGENLRKIFNNQTRVVPAGRKISFVNCESTMYRARRNLQPKIPRNAFELESTPRTTYGIYFPGTTYGIYFQGSVVNGSDRAFIFFSNELIPMLVDVSDICFDGTFFTVPMQFYQLWTIFIVVNQHVIPAIHCLLTGKSEQLYDTLLSKIREIVPQFQLQNSMSDWEQAARKSVKKIFNGIKLQGCWFHYTQRIWKRFNKLILSARTSITLNFTIMHGI